MPDSTHKSLEGGGVASEPRSRGASRAKGSEGASREANSAPGPTKAAPPSSETLLSHFETERPAGFPDQAPTENVIGAGSTRQPASSSHDRPHLCRYCHTEMVWTKYCDRCARMLDGFGVDTERTCCA